ncbi:MAG: CvpA family protein [Verrucomicrobiota bacterium]
MVDVAFFATAVLFALGGSQRGFAAQLAHIITFMALGIFMFFAYPSIFSYMGRLFRDLDEAYMVWMILAALAVFTVVFFIYVSRMLAKMLKKQITDRSDHAYGFMLGFIRGMLVALFAMVFMVILGPGRFYNSLSDRSRIGQFVCYEMVPRIQPRMTRSELESRVDKFREALIYQEEAGVPPEE